MLNIPAMSFGGFRMSWVHETESWEMDTLNHILILTVAKIGHTDHQTWWRARVQLSKQIWYGFTICADNLIYGHVRLSLDWCGLLDSCFKGVWRNEMPENLENGNLKCRNGTRIGARKWNAPLSSQLTGICAARYRNSYECYVMFLIPVFERGYVTWIVSGDGLRNRGSITSESECWSKEEHGGVCYITRL